jgi:hypothetical protein
VCKLDLERAGFGGKDHGLCTYKPVIRTSRSLDSFLYEAAQNFEVFSNIQNLNEKSKTYSG